MKKNVIISGSDKNYFPFLKNLIYSLHQNSCFEFCDICLLDSEDKSEYLDELKDLITEKKKLELVLIYFLKKIIIGLNC